MSIDFSDFDKGFKSLVGGSVPPALNKALFIAGNALLDDAGNIVPRAPFRTGALWASRRVVHPAGTPLGSGVMAGFNIEYAARWHELTPEEDARIHWTLDGSGRKYLEAKLPMFRDQYIKIIADSLAGVFRRE